MVGSGAALMPWLQEVAVALAVVGVLLTIREKRACWLVIVASALLYFSCFWKRAWPCRPACRFLRGHGMLRLVGLGTPGRGARDPALVRVSPRGSDSGDRNFIPRQRLVASALQRGHLPVSGFTGDLGAVLTTFMTARKVLESWLY